MLVQGGVPERVTWPATKTWSESVACDRRAEVGQAFRRRVAVGPERILGRGVGRGVAEDEEIERLDVRST